MNQTLHQRFLEFKEVGKKQEAKAALDAFLRSFESSEQTKSWVREFLEGGGYGHKIRHEIYERLVFPVLLDGYHQQDAWSILWLAKTAVNFYTNRHLHAQVEFVSEHQLLQEAHRLQRSEETRTLLINANLRWFQYCQHEWPAGILYGSNGSSEAECEEILRAVAETRLLDVTQVHETFLQDFERKVKQYQDRFKGGE